MNTLKATNYDVLLFDADETLFDFSKAEKYAISHALKDIGIIYDEKFHLPLYSSINSAIWKEFERGEITQEKLRVERFRRFQTELKANFDYQKLADIYANHLADASYPLPGSEKLLQQLKPHYRMAILTNGLAAIQQKRICESPLAAYFEQIVISENVGVSKPDSRIFQYTLKELSYADSSKVLMIGDSLTSDMQGGINSGIDTCWFNPQKKENALELSLTYEVHSFDELLALLLK